MKKFLFLLALLPVASFAKDFFGINNYQPQAFSEQVSKPFFYSIGNKLKFGNSIDENAPALFEDPSFFQDSIILITRVGEDSLSNGRSVFPSPDGQKAAVYIRGKLYIVEADKPAMLLLENVWADNVAKDLRVGETFYKLSMMQWDAQSRHIYIVKDKKQKTAFEQGWSKDAVLVRIEAKGDGQPVDAISDFRSLKYFFVKEGGLCFNYAPGNGDVIWKCQIDGVTYDGVMTDSGLVLKNGRRLESESIYLSEKYAGGEIWMASNGYLLKKIDHRQVGLYFAQNPQPIFTINGGKNFKGRFVDGIGDERSSVLPGGRYALFWVLHDNFTGQLLVDGHTGQYKELPKNTWVYRSWNSDNYENIKFDKYIWPTFKPTRKFREWELQ